MPNRLKHSDSPYLLKAAEQPVDWFEWGEEAFDEARRRDCPILLSVGGVWCHWCHVMAHESFEDAEIAKLINDHFVPIKVDRDERPDIDKRYQEAVIHISGSGGWPLTAFLTPEGKIFFGGTYFPPEERWHKPGLKMLIVKLAELYHKDRHRIEEAANELYNNILINASIDTRSSIDEMIIGKGISSLLAAVDRDYGGLGKAPKFHHASAFEFLINYNFFEKNEEIGRVIVGALDAMAKGGIYDHLLGGFFRYSTDQSWNIPHFEKMLYDNSELLKLYAIAYKVFGKELYRSTAAGIVDYYIKYGCDEKGAFFTSQDADIGILDEGGYYAFSEDELHHILTRDEYNVTSLHFGIGTVGALHHDESKHVLFLNATPQQIATRINKTIDNVITLIGSAKGKMLQYREQNREMPYIDKSVYSNWNGLMIEGLCVAGNMLGIDEYKKIAERAALIVLDEYYHDGWILHRKGIDGFLEDYIFFASGLVELFQATQNNKYLRVAAELADSAIELFWDNEAWGFFDAMPGEKGYLGIGQKNIQDAPVRSANGVAPRLLTQLGDITGVEKYMDYAEKSLKAFVLLAHEHPTMSYSYLASTHAYFSGTYKVETSHFLQQALEDFRPYKLVIRKDIDGALICEKNTCKVFDKYPMSG
ncbi:MAG TPA: thioredoxin domain-containing protein [Dissulfurispiraceae bacterium]|nr:thioredoxin domain-containing protein [Dissulfurispiraceae bacterium]